MDPNSRKDVRESRKREKISTREREEFLAHMLSLPQGRKFFWEWLGRCGIGRNPYSPEALAMSFSCGEMNIGQQLLEEIVRVAPDRYIQMMEENNERRSSTGDTGPDGDSGSPGGDQPELDLA